ncbi:hypothetical protein V8B55DRAFT_1535164, partial [Mucor lusitanicus]
MPAMYSNSPSFASSSSFSFFVFFFFFFLTRKALACMRPAYSKKKRSDKMNANVGKPKGSFFFGCVRNQRGPMQGIRAFAGQ